MYALRNNGNGKLVHLCLNIADALDAALIYPGHAVVAGDIYTETYRDVLITLHTGELKMIHPGYGDRGTP